ncbi:hypothetical protein [Rickettsia australis]|uniref:hypothetical protein n=1 Tax=Rickettsia australis TaxID=787 RepID=UPI00031E6B3F|nr:hypothetical protein [Rickettsia australis]
MTSSIQSYTLFKEGIDVILYVFAAEEALLRGSENALGVIPWLDHGIQKYNLKY